MIASITNETAELPTERIVEKKPEEEVKPVVLTNEQFRKKIQQFMPPKSYTKKDNGGDEETEETQAPETPETNDEITVEFGKKLYELKTAYKKALGQDYIDSKGQRPQGFAWGEHVGLRQDQMFSQAMEHLLNHISYLQEKETGTRKGPYLEEQITGEYDHLIKDFGPIGTKSGEVIQEIISTVKGACDRFNKVNKTPQARRVRWAYDQFNIATSSEKH